MAMPRRHLEVGAVRATAGGGRRTGRRRVAHGRVRLDGARDVRRRVRGRTAHVVGRGDLSSSAARPWRGRGLVTASLRLHH